MRALHEFRHWGAWMGTLEFLELAPKLALIGGHLALRLRERYSGSSGTPAATLPPWRCSRMAKEFVDEPGRRGQPATPPAASGDRDYQFKDISVRPSHRNHCCERASAIALACDILSTVHSIVTVT